MTSTSANYMGLPKETTKTNNQPAMTAQQQRITSNKQGKLSTYRSLVIGDGGWGYFLGFELYNLLFANLPGALGLGLRTTILPLLLKKSASGLAMGRAVTIREPKRISFGKSVIVDDFVTLDVRATEAKNDSGISIADNSTIGRYTSIVSKNASISLGRACNISSHCRIATESSITIGESVLIAAYCYIGPGNHRFDDVDKPIMSQGMEPGAGVVIGNNVWVGTRATILDGVTIGDNAIIGAHSLVTEDVPANSIVAGTPAKVVRKRTA